MSGASHRHWTLSGGPEEEIAARLGVGAPEVAAPEDFPRVGPRLVHLTLPTPPTTAAERRSPMDGVRTLVAGINPGHSVR